MPNWRPKLECLQHSAHMHRVVTAAVSHCYISVGKVSTLLSTFRFSFLLIGFGIQNQTEPLNLCLTFSTYLSPTAAGFAAAGPGGVLWLSGDSAARMGG